MLNNITFNNCSTGIQFEDWTCSLLRKCNFEAQRVGRNDGGIDIIAVYHTERVDLTFNIQCKFHNSTLGKTPIHEVFSGTHYLDNGGYPVVVTNNTVTATARRYAKKLGVEIIADLEWMEMVQVLKTKHIYNPNPHNGLLGILLSSSLGDKGYFNKTVSAILSAKDRKEQTPPTEKDKLKIELINDFDEAESCIQEAAYLQHKAAQFSQRALTLQKQAVLRNLEYG